MEKSPLAPTAASLTGTACIFPAHREAEGGTGVPRPKEEGKIVSRGKSLSETRSSFLQISSQEECQTMRPLSVAGPEIRGPEVEEDWHTFSLESLLSLPARRGCKNLFPVH